jgi:hypothetical protein
MKSYLLFGFLGDLSAVGMAYSPKMRDNAYLMRRNQLSDIQ